MAGGAGSYTLLGPAAAPRGRSFFLGIGGVALLLCIALATTLHHQQNGEWFLWSSAGGKQQERAGPLFIYPFPDWGEGIGSISMSSKQCGYLAMRMDGVMQLPDYTLSAHGYRIWEALETLAGPPQLPQRRVGKVCPVSYYTDEPGWKVATMYRCGGEDQRMTSIVERMREDGCDTVLCTYRGERMHGGADILRWLHSDAYAEERQARQFIPGGDVVQIHAHVRWGDTATGADESGHPGFEAYGKVKTCDLQAVADYARHLELQGRAYALTIFTERGANGSLPAMPQLEGIPYEFDLTPDVRYVVANLGECDVFFTGGSQMAVLAASIATAPIVAFPDGETGYFGDSCEVDKRYFKSGKLREMMAIGAI